MQEALNVPQWKEDVLEEMRASEKNATWEKMDMPDGMTIISCKYVFALKYNADGSLEKYKTHLVAKGFTQTYVVDYSKTLSSGKVKYNSITLINLDWPLNQLDVKNAFLNGDFEAKVYMKFPTGFTEQFGLRCAR